VGHSRPVVGLLYLYFFTVGLCEYYRVPSMCSTRYAKQKRIGRKEFGVGGVLYFSFLFSEIFFIKGYLFYPKY